VNINFNRPDFVVAAVAAGFRLLAVSSHWPYSFYVLMRITVCAIAIYLGYNSFVAGRTMWVWVLGSVAVLFNPVLPIRMHRSDLRTLDMIGASIFILWVIATLVRDRSGLVRSDDKDGK